VIIALTAIILAIFLVFETRLPEFGGSTSRSGNIIFFLLINLNLILLVLLIFLVTRNLVKLVFERRRRILGARLRTRLVMAFVGLSLVPTILLFFVAQAFLSVTIESWFGGQVERSLESSLEIAQRYYQEAGNNALHHAQGIAQQIRKRDLLAQTRRSALQRLLDEKRAELNVAGLEVFTRQGAAVTSLSDEVRAQLPPVLREDLDAVLIGGRAFARTQALRRREVVRAGAPISEQPGEIEGAVVVDHLIPKALVRAARGAVAPVQQYRQLRVLKQPFKNSYTVSFLLITLVVIFSATWFGFYLAKGITVPIQKLGEGMREVAQGNWDYRAEPAGDEEIATLIDSFNRMTAELKTIHHELQERHRYIESILANITAGVVSVDADGVVATVNPAAGAMLGLRPEEVRGRTWQEVFQGPDLRQVGELIGRLADGGGANVEGQIKLASGTRVLTAWVTATVLTDDSGAPRGSILFFEDVTHLLRVERMEAWREVARRIAHEIKNPLTPIQLSAQRLRKRYGKMLGERDGELLDECTRTIIDQVEQLKRLVNEFSTFARLPAAEVAPHDLNSVVEETLVLFREGHPGITFDFSPDPTVPVMEFDGDAVRRAVINMVDNAIAACSDTSGEAARVEISTFYDMPMGIVRLEVADNGCGMTPDVKARAFEPYFSTKRDGTGLGLAIVSAIAADHQAYVRIRDNEPRGTRMIIEFPHRRGARMRAAAQG
jgi:two-component system nitrogen regulation sensor histidine kinase NtrY